MFDSAKLSRQGGASLALTIDRYGFPTLDYKQFEITNDVLLLSLCALAILERYTPSSSPLLYDN